MAAVTPPTWCAEEELLSAYLDGELRAGEIAVVVQHLDACATCRSSFSGMKTVRSAVRTLPTLEPPPGLFDIGHLGHDLSAYLDGELTGAESAEVTEHLARCGECRRELQELDGARTAIRSLPRIELPVELRSPAPVVDDEGVGWLRRRRLPVAAAVAGAVAACVVVVNLLGGDGVTIDRGLLAERHTARVSVGSGASVLPASFPASEVGP